MRAAGDEIETTLARFETKESGFVGPCEMLVGSARAERMAEASTTTACMAGSR